MATSQTIGATANTWLAWRHPTEKEQYIIQHPHHPRLTTATATTTVVRAASNLTPTPNVNATTLIRTSFGLALLRPTGDGAVLPKVSFLVVCSPCAQRMRGPMGDINFSRHREQQQQRRRPTTLLYLTFRANADIGNDEALVLSTTTREQSLPIFQPRGGGGAGLLGQMAISQTIGANTKQSYPKGPSEIEGTKRRAQEVQERTSSPPLTRKTNNHKKTT